MNRQLKMPLYYCFDEVIERALRQEKFLISFPESSKVPEVKNLYEKYLSFIFRP